MMVCMKMVNYYWKTSDGKLHCKEMNTGDSNIILPYVPHTFTCRDASQEAYIVAVTWTHPGPMFRCPSTGSSVLDLDVAGGDVRRPPAAQLRTIVNRHLRAEIMTVDDLLGLLPSGYIDDAKTLLVQEISTMTAQMH